MAAVVLVTLGGLLIWRVVGGGDSEPQVATTPAVTAPTAGTSTPTPRTTTPTATPTPSPTTSATVASPAGSGGQATPDAAAQVFLRAFGNTDARAACSVMAGGNLALETDNTFVDACAKALQPTLDSNPGAFASLRTATVSGATVTGDTATFGSATVRPSEGASLLEDFTAKRIDGKW